MSMERSPVSPKAIVTAGSLVCLLASWALLLVGMLVFTHALFGPWWPSPGQVVPRAGTASRLWYDVSARGPRALLPTLVILGTSVGLFVRQAIHTSRLARLALRFAAINVALGSIAWLATRYTLEWDQRLYRSLLATSGTDLDYSFSRHAVSIYFWILLLLVGFWLQLVPAGRRGPGGRALESAKQASRPTPDKPGRRKLACALGAALATIAFVPVGLYLQWWLPIDGPGELFVSLISLPLLLAGLGLLSRPVVVPARPQKSRRMFLAVGFLIFFGLIQATIFSPSIARRIGPWHELRARLVSKSQEISEARARLGGAENADLTREQWTQIEQAVFPTPQEFVFPIIHQRVTLKLMSHQPPYVGIRYGRHGDRGVVFDLDAMCAIYAD